MPALLADVDGDADALVAVVFDGLDVALPHCHRLAGAFAHLGLGRAGAALDGIIENILRDLTELVGAVGKMGIGHLTSVARCSLFATREERQIALGLINSMISACPSKPRPHP